MAVTLTATELAAALRLGDSPEETAEATRLLAYVQEAVTRHVETAPDAVHNEAARRLAGYLFDQPEAARGDAYAAAGRNSGAWAILAPYRIRRAGTIGEAVQIARESGTPGNPVTNVQVNGGELVVSYADGTVEHHALPAGMGGMFNGVDQTARNSANTAQAAADAAQADATANTTTQTAHAADPNAHHIPPAGSTVDVFDGAAIPADAVAMRLGWNQSETFAESHYVRANNHPIDGVSVGTTAGLLVPPFPPALNTDTTLYLGVWIAYTGDVPIRQFPGDPITYSGTDYFSAPVPLTVDGVIGQSYSLSVRLDADTYAAAGNEFFVTIPGEAIATETWVTTQIAAIPAPTGGTSGAPVLIGSASVPAGQTPFVLRMPTAATTAFYAAYNASTYEGGYRVDFNWTVGTLNHAFSAVLGPSVWPAMGDNQSYQWHMDVGAALDGTSTRLINFNRIGTDYIKFQSLPASDDLDAGTTFKLWGLP